MQRTQMWTKTDDDYDHWKNMTARIDWKRLGIICQLERQMETTYKVYDRHLDELPYNKRSAEHRVRYVADFDLPLPPIAEAMYTSARMDDLSPQWYLYDDDYSDTNYAGWTYPTCRVPRPLMHSGITMGSASGDLGGEEELDAEEAAELMALIARTCGLTNDTYNLVVRGEWTANGAAFEFHPSAIERWAWAEFQSSTVTFAVDGTEYTVREDRPVESGSWNFYDPGTTIGVELRKRGGSRWDFSFYSGDRTWEETLVYYAYAPVGGTTGSFAVPATPTFTALGEGDDYTQWEWTATGIASSNCTKTVSGQDVTWTWDDGSAMGIGYDANYGVYYQWCDPVSTDPDLQEQTFFVTNITRSVRFPNLAVRWNTTTRREWQCVGTNDFPAQIAYTLPIVFEATNVSVRADLGMDKETRGMATYSTGDGVMELIAARFYRPLNEDWDRIYEQSRPTVDCMISDVGANATNDTADALLEDEFTWENIKSSSRALRQFRLSPEDAAATNLTIATTVRWKELHSLSEACKTECVARGGYDIGQFASVSRISGAEQGHIISLVDDKELVAKFVITVSNDFLMAASVSPTNVPPYVVVGDVTAGYGVTNALPAWVGSYAWEIEPIQLPVTNEYDSVRADGVQAPVTKTVWKFKNLRDPSL